MFLASRNFRSSLRGPSKKFLLFIAATFMLIGLPAYAQGGCIDSPENPTAILACVGGSVFAAGVLREKFRARGAKK
jgi:XrtJ-associated TM-motif-TM protein